MFEQEYTRANDRIHPRKELLQELEAKWAAEQAQQAEEEKKVVAFPAWAKYMSMAAGVLLCIGLGMGSVLLFSRTRGGQPKNARAEAPQMAESRVEAQEEAKIVTDTTADMALGEEAPEEAEQESMLMMAGMAAPKPQGMHRAADEAEVEDAIRYGHMDRGEEETAAAPAEAASTQKPQNKASALTEAKGMMKAGATASSAAGEILTRDDLMAVFLPTAEQIQIVRYANRRATREFSLGLRESGAQVKKVFWMGNELLTLREHNGDTELMRFDVTDWKKPRHLTNLTQSGTFLTAGEMGGRVYILSLYGATDQEPRPWVNGERIDFADVLLDEDRPGDVFTLLTVYDPAQGELVSQTALLLKAQGAAVAGDRLILWTGMEETDLYAVTGDEDGLNLAAEHTVPGAVVAAATREKGLTLLLDTDDGATLLTLDGDLAETGAVVAKTGGLRCGEVFEEDAFFLTDSELHWLSSAGDRVLETTGDGLRRLSEDRMLVFWADGKLQLVSVTGDGLKALGTADTRNSLALLLEDPTRMDYDPATGRLALPAGQQVYQYRVSDEGELTLWGMPLIFYDHNETDQRELRCRMTAEGVLVFYKTGVIVCNQTLERLLTTRY